VTPESRTSADDSRVPAALWQLGSWLLTRSGRTLERQIAEGLAAHGRTKHEYAVLVALDELGPASQVTLSRRCSIDPGEMVAVLNELEARGLARRTRDPLDARRNIIEITPQGSASLPTLDELAMRIQDDFFVPLTSEERATLQELLQRLLRHHLATEQAVAIAPPSTSSPA
jgi:DNA-binding MarR family transcriptional regulator